MTDKTDLSAAKCLLDHEIDGLKALHASLGDEFIKALTIMQETSGRVVVTGMGKSGHIGRKISATLASTGAPSFYIHPGEASHGDLGMLTPYDVVLALSNSGETPELQDILGFCRRFDIPMIAISSKADSTLGRHANAMLELPSTQEGCPLGLAPTTSTTMMLALGDALAVALLERKGFSADDFHARHPGGKLGQNLLQVSELMHDKETVPLCTPEENMEQALEDMSAGGFGCIGIVNGKGVLTGIITDGDLRRHMNKNILACTAKDIMSKGPKTIDPTSLAAEALHIMNEKKITSLFVTDKAGKPVGVLHIHDCLKAGLA